MVTSMFLIIAVLAILYGLFGEMGSGYWFHYFYEFLGIKRKVWTDKLCFNIWKFSWIVCGIGLIFAASHFNINMYMFCPLLVILVPVILKLCFVFLSVVLKLAAHLLGRILSIIMMEVLLPTLNKSENLVKRFKNI